MTEQFQIGPAKREGVPVFIGIAGPSSSGKTFSALRVGTGIQRVVGGDIAVIDTEGKRALHYADQFKFLHVPFGGPFNALRYLEALRFVVGKGIQTIIVDSMSHEHEGDGGHLAMHEAQLDKMAGDDWKKREKVTFAAWAKPAAERRALLNGIQQMRANIIFCFRAKDKLALIKNSEGKMEPTRIGWQPIAGTEYVFDMTALVVLPPRSNGVADWDAEACKNSKGLKGIFQKGPLDEATGERQARWGQRRGRTRPTDTENRRRRADKAR